MTVIAPGSPAPEFGLATPDGDPFTRESLLGAGTSVLVFYPFAFSPVCTDQLSIYDGLADEFAAHGARLYGVSCDSHWAQAAFVEKLGVTSIPQRSDFEPKGATCAAFGVLHPGGFPQRALVIIDPRGTVTWSYQADSPGDLPGANLIFDGLAAARQKS